MAEIRDIGEKLVLNFSLLLEYWPDDKCQEYVRKDMLSVPEFQATQHIVSFLLNILNPNWKSKLLGELVTFMDWNILYTTACNHFNKLRMEYSDLDIPFMVPSALKCFWGPKSREVLWKLTSVIMLFVMKRDEYNEEVADENNYEVIKKQLEQNECLKKQIAIAGKETEEKLSIKNSILSRIIRDTAWEKRKLELLDFTNGKIISELKEDINGMRRELNVLKKELTPHLERVYQDTGICQCSASNGSDHAVQPHLLRSELERHFQMANENFLKRHVNNLMLADDLRSIRKQKERSETVSEYIRRLELLNSCNIGTDIFVNKLSPVNQNNSGMDVVDTFTPGQVSGERAINFRKRPLTIDPNSVADLVVPPKILSLQSIVPKIGKKKVAFEGSPNLPDISQRIKFAAKNRVVCFPATQRNQDLNRAACGDVAWQPQPHSVPSKVSESVGKWRTSTRNRAGELCNPCGIVGKRLDGTENELWDRQSNLGCTTSDISGKVDAMSEKNRGMMQEGHLDCDTLELGKDVLRTPKCRLRPKSSGKNLFDECFWMESTSSSQVFDSFSFSNKLNLAKEVDSAVFSLSKMETESRSVHSCICESSLCLLNSCLQNSFTLTDEITSPIGN